MMRIGQGFDVHPFEAGRPLVLGGVTIEHSAGLAGHSDGDALCHAIIDALLGAAGMGDIGTHFPSNDSALEGANSLHLLQSVVERLRASGFSVVNVDATIVAQEPRMAPHIAEMGANLSQACGAPVNIKATTTDHLGAIGRGEGIAAMVVALIEEG